MIDFYKDLEKIIFKIMNIHLVKMLKLMKKKKMNYQK